MNSSLITNLLNANRDYKLDIHTFSNQSDEKEYAFR